MPEVQSRTAEFFRILRDNLPELRKQYGVSYLGIFGSYLRGEEREDRDLDVLVEFDRIIDLLEFVALQSELGDLLGVDVDLVMKSALKPRIGKRILAEVVTL
ncbi:MAG: nucleotidyltransferase family protein [Chloroflexi bacterium]|nr:nucleotidyltransferase family protein [Chloroflexota bacterium]